MITQLYTVPENTGRICNFYFHIIVFCYAVINYIIFILCFHVLPYFPKPRIMHNRNSAALRSYNPLHVTCSLCVKCAIGIRRPPKEQLPNLKAPLVLRKGKWRVLNVFLPVPRHANQSDGVPQNSTNKDLTTRHPGMERHDGRLLERPASASAHSNNEMDLYN